MKLVTLVAAMACLVSAELSLRADAQNALVPILVELFTSEGCSSCPPADAWLQHLDASQPIPGVLAIVLSEHVDYWNHDGWKDPYSSSLFTDRQSAYVRALGLSSPYTPQVIVDGKSELRLNDLQQISQVFKDAAKSPQIHVSIGTIRIEGNTPAILRAHIEADGTASPMRHICPLRPIASSRCTRLSVCSRLAACPERFARPEALGAQAA